MRILLLSILFFFSINLCFADGIPCYDSSWLKSEYTHPKRGDVSLYLVPDNYDISPTNLACVTIVSLLERRSNVPNKMITGLITEDFKKAFIVKWSIKQNTLVLLEIDIPDLFDSWEGKFTIYPEPLKRLKELMIVRRFPTPKQLPPHLRNKFKTNFMVSSSSSLESLFNNNDYY
jgi:hypothetical protein